MKSITQIIIGLVGISAIGLVTYYLVVNQKNTGVHEKQNTNQTKDTVGMAKTIQDKKFDKIKEALNIDGEEFTPTDVEGVYTNSTNDKMLIIEENVWKKMIQKIQKQFPNIAKDCNDHYEMPELSEYKIVGLLTYYADRENIKTTSAYGAIEIRNGHAKSYSGGAICCECDAEPAVAQKVDAIIEK